MNFIYYQVLQLAGCYCISFSNIFFKTKSCCSNNMKP